MFADTGIKIYYIGRNAFFSLIRRKGYIYSYVMIGLLFFLFFFAWKWVGFFSSWIDLETAFQKAAAPEDAYSFQPLLLLLSILRVGAIIISVFLALAVVLYTKHFYKQKAVIEQEELFVKRLLGESTPVIALEFVLEAGYVLIFFGSVALILSIITFQKLIQDIHALGAFQKVVEVFHVHTALEILWLFSIIGMVLSSIFYAVYRQVNNERQDMPSSKKQQIEEADWT